MSGTTIGGTGGVAADSQVVKPRELNSDITVDFFRSTMRAFRDPQQYTNADIAPLVALANRSMPRDRWGEFRDYGECLFVAHFLVLAARANRVADAGGIPGQPSGVISSKGVGGASMSFDTQAGTLKDGGQWNTTSFGIQWLTFARLVGMGGLQSGGPDIPLGPTFGAPWGGVEQING